MDCVTGDTEANLIRIAARAAEAAERGAQLVLFPECATTGYFVADRIASLAEPVPGPSSERLARLARSTGVHLMVGMIERAEDVLHDLGFYDVRVRHHEWGGVQALKSLSVEAGQASTPSTLQRFNASTNLARIELGPAEVPRFLSDGLMVRVAAALKEIGYAHVTLDLEGYRRGSVNGVAKERSAADSSRPDAKKGA